MASGEIRTGVVGLGYFGSFHARHHAANPKARLVGVVDADRGRAEAHGAEHGAEPLLDHRELIGRVDAVSITVPTSLHHAVAADFIDAGVDVLIEKPIADSEAAAEDLVRRAERTGVVLQVGHIERFSPVFRTLAGKVRAPRVAEFTRIGAWKGRAIDVAVVLDLMIHDIDLVTALAGGPPETVDAVGCAVASERPDFAVAHLGFPGGRRATITASRVSIAMERRLRVLGTEGELSVNFLERSLAVLRRGGAEPVATMPGSGLDRLSWTDHDSLEAEQAGFVAAVLGEAPPVVDGDAGLAALKVALAVEEAMERNRLIPAA